MTPVSDQTDDMPQGFSALEEALLGDGAGAVLAERLSWIAQTRQAVKRHIDTGVSPDEHAAGTALLGALDAANTILETPISSKET
ncbi:hypothetical protein [Marivita sp. GX14005]|uniref:hypothetical protein n=1 Tax=Marivita sp. GX14005 TaxID=2942276 RepID=UPI002018F2CA|nr:hypothetical protein [Marivita sp. GX14005]MCL3883325.1 hypothetical protein [Marivita sp. GX14005]